MSATDRRSAVSAAFQANKDHQYALKGYTENLEAELATVDKLIAAIDSAEEVDEDFNSGIVRIEGAVKPVSFVLPRYLLSEESPYYKDANWRRTYDEFTTVNQMKAKEHDALRDAIRSENQRMLTLQAHNRGEQFNIGGYPPEYFEQNVEGLDWKRVAIKVNAAIPSGIERSPKELKVRWLGYLHPSFNHGPWTAEEVERLRCIIDDIQRKSEQTRVDWTEVSKLLGTNRTPIDCMQHGSTRRTHSWTPEADRRLLEAVDTYGKNNWQLVAMHVSEDATAHQCQKRYFDTLDPSLTGGIWSAEEDERLLRAVSAFSSPTVIGAASGSSSSKGEGPRHKDDLEKAKPVTAALIPWQEVALFVRGRNNNQCRERWQDSLSRVRSNGKRRDEAVPEVEERSLARIKKKREGKHREEDSLNRTTMHPISEANNVCSPPLSSTSTPNVASVPAVTSRADADARDAEFIPSTPTISIENSGQATLTMSTTLDHCVSETISPLPPLAGVGSSVEASLSSSESAVSFVKKTKAQPRPAYTGSRNHFADATSGSDNDNASRKEDQSANKRRSTRLASNS